MRRITIFLLLMILSAGNAFAQKQEGAQKQSGKADNAAETADLIVAEAKKYLGRPWVWAANGPDSFDCTGLTKFIYAKFGYTLGRTVPGQMANGRIVEGDFHNLQKGDIIIWGSRADKSKPGHVGIFIAEDASGKFFTFIHTSCSRGVVVSRSNETYYKDRYLGARRILPDFGKAAKQKKYHTVESGDTLYAIAGKYNTKVSEICQLNGIQETDILKIGTKLRVK